MSKFIDKFLKLVKQSVEVVNELDKAESYYDGISNLSIKQLDEVARGDKAMEISEIAEFIIKEYPDSCVASCGISPSDFKNEYCEDMLVSYLMDFFSYEILNLCGCGIPENTHEVIRRILNIRNLWSEDKLTYDEVQEKYKEELRIDTEVNIDYGLLQFVLYALDSAGILEHGSSIGGCWLSSLGKMYLIVLNTWRKIEDEEGECEE